MDLGRPWVQRMLVLALALTIGVIVWMATREGEDETPPATAPGGARIVSEAELAAIPAAAGHPVYWVGPIEGTDLEATENADGGVLVSLRRGRRRGGRVGQVPRGRQLPALRT